MDGTSLIAFVGLLVGALLVIVAMVVWQEARRSPSYDPLTYVVDDAVKHIAAGLAEDGSTNLTKGDIQRIIEWEIFYLQGLAQENRRNPVETVAGGIGDSIDFIVAEIEESHGVSYDPGDVADVLRYEADYLTRIGAVGEPVNPDGGELK